MIKKLVIEVFWNDNDGESFIKESTAFKKLSSVAKMDLREDIMGWCDEIYDENISKATKGE